MSETSGTFQLTAQTDPASANLGKGRIFWDQVAKVFKQIDDVGLIQVMTGAIGWGSITGTIEDQLDLNQRIRTELVIKSLSDLTQFLVGTSYELPSGRYVFDQDLNIGTNNFKLIDASKFYTFKFSDINTVTYTGSASMFESTVSGVAIKMDDGFLVAPNASEIFLMTNGNSIILTLTVLVGKKAATLTNCAFVTLNDLPLVGCDDGMECINCGTITAKLLQWNSGTNTGGTGLRVSGASSERLIMTTSDARPESTEAYLDIDSTYGGVISISGGVFQKSLNGDFFKSSGKDQTDPTISLANVVNVKDSAAEIFGHFAGNSTATVITTQNTPVKINAVWSDIQKERFTFNSNGTWTYTGLEDLCIAVSLTATVNPTGGGSVSVSTYFAKNGSVLANTRGNVTASTGGQITSIAIIDISTTDTIEAFIENNTSTANLTVEVASIRIP